MTAVVADPLVPTGVWPSTRRLRAALRANAVFSLVCGTVLLAAGWRVAEPWGLGPVGVPPAVGAGVAGFGALVAWVAVQPTGPLVRWAALIVASDIAWVSGSTVLMVWHPLPWPGAVAATVVAAAVAALVAAQIAG
ncbi:hypothetical protein [Streptomyces sp. NPDC018833]|uniref:hypothetical protein n=1 Tax=Streptomyces sp. NPDC018833 TaxID=3365053 RepID=UPI0037A04935